jgi:glycine betaine/proline transport system ATP-binding protein
MSTKTVVARFKKEGPEVLIRKMRQRNLISLPVVEIQRSLIGEVLLNDLLELRKEESVLLIPLYKLKFNSVLSDTL